MKWYSSKIIYNILIRFMNLYDTFKILGYGFWLILKWINLELFLNNFR